MHTALNDAGKHSPGYIRKLARSMDPDQPGPHFSRDDWRNVRDLLNEHARRVEAPCVLHLWHIVTETDDGNVLRTFTSEEAMLAAYAETVAATWRRVRMVQPMPADPVEAYDVLTGTPGFMDLIYQYESAVEVQP